jgi:hypothetical protein
MGTTRKRCYASLALPAFTAAAVSALSQLYATAFLLLCAVLHGQRAEHSYMVGSLYGGSHIASMTSIHFSRDCCES